MSLIIRGTFHLYEDGRSKPVWEEYRPHAFLGGNGWSIRIRDILDERSKITPGDTAEVEMEFLVFDDQEKVPDILTLREGPIEIGELKVKKVFNKTDPPNTSK